MKVPNGKLVSQKEICKHLSKEEDTFIRLKRKYPILEKIQVEAKLNDYRRFEELLVPV